MRRRRVQKTDYAGISHLISKSTIPVAVAVVLGAGLIQYFDPVSVQERRAKADLRLQRIENEIAQERGLQEARRGNSRYANNCQMIFDPNQTDSNGFHHVVIPLSEGMAIYTESGNPLPDGQLVCDHQFMTFVMRNGVTTDPAKANDAALVNKRFDDNVGWNPNSRRSAIHIGQ